MPSFDKVQVADTTVDLTEYKKFLKKLAVGQVVTLPLESGETPRKVMRQINAAAEQEGMRLSRMDSGSDAVRFKVAPPEKRTINMSAEARQARVQKAVATRKAKQEAAKSQAAKAARARARTTTKTRPAATVAA